MSRKPAGKRQRNRQTARGRLPEGCGLLPLFFLFSSGGELLLRSGQQPLDVAAVHDPHGDAHDGQRGTAPDADAGKNEGEDGAGQRGDQRRQGLEAEKATYSAAIPQGRLQILRFVAQVQCDMYFHDGLTAVGLNGHLGYNLEFGDYGLDLLTGIGIEQFLEDKDSTVYKAYSFGFQGYKRIFFSGFGSVAPRIQWTLKTFKYKSPETGRRRRVYINQFYIGAILDFVIPFSEIH